MKYDFLIVGSGIFGATCAYELNKKGYKVCVLEKKNHIGGNCYTEKWDDINIHIYGAHIFHTSNEKVWNWINQFTEFNSYTHTIVANYKNEIYPLPFNMFTFSKMWNITHPKEAKKIIKRQSKKINKPNNLEEQAIKLVGTDVYEKLIKGYTTKQWKKEPKDLPKEIINRLPVRFTYDNNYFNDKYQGIPIGGYTQIFEKLLDGIDVIYNTDYLLSKSYWDDLSDKIIYTGTIDSYYNYQYGYLEYKTVRLEHEYHRIDNYQGTSIINYTDIDIPYTRIIEHKHFENSKTDSTWISKEYPIEYIPEKIEPSYPVNDEINNEIYLKYKQLSLSQDKVLFGGRLGEYKYYDMDKVLLSAFEKLEEWIKNIHCKL